MDLPSFLWLWKIAAWSMGLAVAVYLWQGATGIWMLVQRKANQPRPNWLRPLHYATGGLLVGLVLILLAIGIVGTLGHYGTLGHSSHLAAGLTVVMLVLVSSSSALRIDPQRPWARSLHLSSNIALLMGYVWVLLTGWDVVQKYLP